MTSYFCIFKMFLSSFVYICIYLYRICVYLYLFIYICVYLYIFRIYFKSCVHTNMHETNIKPSVSDLCDLHSIKWLHLFENKKHHKSLPLAHQVQRPPQSPYHVISRNVYFHSSHLGKIYYNPCCTVLNGLCLDPKPAQSMDCV
jgi:Ca2+/Na+ antiporter